LQLVEQFRLRYAQNERAAAMAFFAAGFVFDILTVGRIDAWLTIAQQAAYLGVIGFALTQMLLEEGTPARDGWWFRWRSAVVHFLLGALLNLYTIFFFKSSSLLVSFSFLAFLLALVLANVMNVVRQAAISYLPSRGSLAYHNRGAAGLTKWVMKAWWVLLGALLPFGVVLVGFPDWVLGMAYGDRYATPELALILALSAASQCILFVKYPFDIGLLALRHTKAIFYIHLIPVVLLFTTGLALIYFLGILGAPLSAMLISSLLLGITWRTYGRLVRERAATQSQGPARD